MKHRVVKITAVIKRQSYKRIIESLNSLGIDNLLSEAGREPVLEEHRGIRALFTGGDSLASEPVSSLSFYIPLESEESILFSIANAADLHIPGMGILYSEDVELLQDKPMCHPGRPPVDKKKDYHFLNDVAGIYCLLPRGDADRITRAVLEAGFSVPTVTYGEGIGLRNRLGLLRITIPAEKEIVRIITSSQDLEAAMELIIEAGKLDQPGRGFINTFSVRKAILNTKITRGRRSQAASTEQIVAALDQLKGNMEWRVKGHGATVFSKRKFLRNLIDIQFTCDEGEAREFVQLSMDVGARGATISKARFVDTGVDPDLEKVPRAREITSLSVNSGLVDPILKSFAEKGIFSNFGSIIKKPVPLALTYMGESPDPE
jgi:nitrogen regulatory protein PII